MSEPLLTVVVPSLNQGRFLGIALQSLVGQNADDLEIIVVDGGSKDGSVEVIKKFVDRIAWWCSEPDKGQSDALNKGLAHATGRYLTWLNADDVMCPRALAAVREYCRANPRTEWVVGDFAYLNEDGTIHRCFKASRWHDFLWHHYPVRVPGPSAVFSRTLWKRAGGMFDVGCRYAMDTELWMRFRQCGARYEVVNRYLWGFRCHPSSKTNAAVYARPSDAAVQELSRLAAKYGFGDLFWGGLRFRLWRALTFRQVAGSWDRIRGVVPSMQNNRYYM